MIYFSTAALTILLVGIFTSKQLIEVGQLLFFIACLKCLYDSFKSKSLALPKSAYWLLAFIGIALLSIIVNDDIISRPSINRARLKYPLLGVLGIYFFRYWIEKSNDLTKKWVLNLFFISVIVSSIYGIVTFFTHDLRRINGLIYTMKQGYGSAMFLILLLGLIIHRKHFQKWLNLKLCYTTFAITFIAMTMTFTRGAMLGFLCGVPVLLYFYRKRAALIFGSISLILVFTMGGYYLFGKKNTNIRFLVTKENTSDSNRKNIFKAALYAVKEKPLLGLGYYNFKPHVQRIREDYNLPPIRITEAHAHNNFLEIASGTGLIGLFAFVGWLTSWAIYSFKSYWGKALIIPFGVVFIISGMFELTIIDSHLSALIYIIYSISSSEFKPPSFLSSKESES